MADALDALRAAVAPTGDLSRVKILGPDGPVEQINDATQIQFDLPDGPVTFPSSEPTRLAATLASAQDGTAQSKPDGLLPLDALVFAIKTKDETSGTYTRLRAAAKVARLELVYRSEIIDYLLGKRATWDGVVSTSPSTDEAVPESSTTPPASPSQALREKHAAPTAQPEKKATSAVKRTYEPDEEDKAFVKRIRSEVEMVPRNRNDAAHGTMYWAQTADFAHFRATIAERLEAMRKLVTGKGQETPAATAPAQAPQGLARRQRAQDPIILLSNSPTALVNMFNVKQLLEEGVFVHPDQARREARGVAETVVTLSHTMSFARSTIPGQPPKPTRFLVVDNVDALNKLAGPPRPGVNTDPWNRVAAIFTTGQTWQFKAYKEQDPKRLFQRYLGLYARYHNEARHENIPLWHVRELVVDRNQRHTDKQVAAGFWRLIEHNIQMRT